MHLCPILWWQTQRIRWTRTPILGWISRAILFLQVFRPKLPSYRRWKVRFAFVNCVVCIDNMVCQVRGRAGEMSKPRSYFRMISRATQDSDWKTENSEMRAEYWSDAPQSVSKYEQLDSWREKAVYIVSWGVPGVASCVLISDFWTISPKSSPMCLQLSSQCDRPNNSAVTSTKSTHYLLEWIERAVLPPVVTCPWKNWIVEKQRCYIK